MSSKRYIAFVTLSVIVFGVWYCLNFDRLNINNESNNKTISEINWQNSSENNNNTIDKSPNLEENSIEDKININTASESELQSINGIGENRAKKIISYRNEHNGFKSTDELKNISGIGDKLFDKIKKYITI
jgi:competence protein comEA helix-hairpin-helix repeat region